MEASPVVACPGCGLVLQDLGLPAEGSLEATGECRALYWELTGSTLTTNGREFWHQAAVDAYGAQHAGRTARPLSTALCLIGLCLIVERGKTGREAQLAHMELAPQKIAWPLLEAPASPADLTVRDVLQVSPGPERDAALQEWAKAVWHSWAHVHDWVRTQCDERL